MGLRLQSELNRMVQEIVKSEGNEADPEPLYYLGTLLAFASKNDEARHMIQKAVERNYCAYSALRNDPLLATLRRAPRFAELVKAARFCQEPVLAQKKSGGD